MPRRKEVCRAEGCLKRPSYGFRTPAGAEGAGISAAAPAPPRRAPPQWCAKHAPPGAVDVLCKHCEAEGCTKIPSFGMELRRARWCKEHVPEGSGARDVVSKRCEFPDCLKIPSYGFLPKKARWCAKHAPEGSWDVKSRRCEAKDCQKQPHYGLEPRKARWCAAHAPPDAHDVVNRQCEAPGCTTRPHYGLKPGTNNMRWCRKHCPGDISDLFTSSGKRATGLPGQAVGKEKMKKTRANAPPGTGKENSLPRGNMSRVAEKPYGRGPKGEGNRASKGYGRGLVVKMDGHSPALALQALAGIAASMQAVGGN